MSQLWRLSPKHLTPGTQVKHQTHGVGEVMGEWGMIDLLAEGRKAGHTKAAGSGIYDVQFGTGNGRYLHCCRGEFLERIL